MILRMLRTTHAWGGATLALLMLLVSFTGAMLVWRLDYLRLAIPEARVDYQPTVESLAAIAQTVETHFGAANLRQIDFPGKDFAVFEVIANPTAASQ